METNNQPLRPYSKKQALLCASLIYALALTFRLVFIFQSHAFADFHTPTPGLDTSMHWEGAKHIRAGTPDPCFELMPPSAPFHPYFVAYCQTVLGENLLTHRIFRAVLSSFTSVFIFFSVLMLSRKIWASLLAGIAGATLHSWIYFDTVLVKAGIELFMLSLIVLLCFSAPKKGSTKTFLGLGLLLGILLSLMRFSQGGTTLFFIIISAYFLLQKSMPTWTARLAVVLPMVIFVLGSQFAFKNREALFGIPQTRFLPVSGVHVRIGFQHNAIGTYHVLKRFPALPLGHTYFARMAAEARAGRPLTPAEANQSYIDEAKEFVRENPGETVQILLRKMGLFFNNLEPAGNHYLPHLRKRIPVLRLPHTGYGLLVILSVWGVWALVQKKSYAHAGLLVGLCLSVLLVNLMSFVTARYRIHATIPLMILSGIGLPFLVEKFKDLTSSASSTKERLRFAATLLLATLFTGWLAYRTVLPNARKLMHTTADRNAELSQACAGIQEDIEKLLGIPRRNAQQQYLLGSLYHRAGRYTDCYNAFKVVAMDTPELIPLTRQYLVFTMWYGDYDHVAAYLRAVRRDRPQTFQTLIRAFDSESNFWQGGDMNLRLIVQALLRDFILPELNRPPETQSSAPPVMLRY